MKRIFISLAVAMLLLIVLASIAYAATGVTDPVVLRDLALVRQATAKYHDVDVAIADGYVPTDACDEIPGTGGGWATTMSTRPWPWTRRSICAPPRS